MIFCALKKTDSGIQERSQFTRGESRVKRDSEKNEEGGKGKKRGGKEQKGKTYHPKVNRGKEKN